MPSGGIEADDPPRFVHDLQSAADVQRRSRLHFPPLDQRKLRRAAADIDIENAFAGVVRHARRARAEGREHGFHVMPGARADEFPALLREKMGDRLGVFPAQRLAGQDHDSGVDVVGMELRRVEGAVDDRGQQRIVDELLALVRRQRNRRLVQSFPGHNEVAARELLAHAPQIQAGEDDLGSRGPDVDPDAGERYMILDPERVVLKASAGVEMIVVVIRALFAFVGVIVVRAVEMVPETVLAFGCGFVVVRHQGNECSIQESPARRRTRKRGWRARQDLNPRPPGS